MSGSSNEQSTADNEPGSTISENYTNNRNSQINSIADNDNNNNCNNNNNNTSFLAASEPRVVVNTLNKNKKLNR